MSIGPAFNIPMTFNGLGFNLYFYNLWTFQQCRMAEMNDAVDDSDDDADYSKMDMVRIFIKLYFYYVFLLYIFTKKYSDFQ